MMGADVERFARLVEALVSAPDAKARRRAEQDLDELVTSRGPGMSEDEAKRSPVAMLTVALEHPNSDVRSYAATMFGKTGDPEAVVPLVQRLLDVEFDVRVAAAHALAALGEHASELLLSALFAGEDYVRFGAASALTEMGDPRAVEQIKRSLLDEGSGAVWAGAYALYADHYQFYLQDSSAAPDTAAPDFWSREAYARKLGVAGGLVAVGTARYATVPVQVEVYDAEPREGDLWRWEHIVEASLDVPTGVILIDGCLSLSPESPRIRVKQGTYRVRACMNGLGSVVDDWEGDDYYRVALWPAEHAHVAVIRQYEED